MSGTLPAVSVQLGDLTALLDMAEAAGALRDPESRQLVSRLTSAAWRREQNVSRKGPQRTKRHRAGRKERQRMAINRNLQQEQRRPKPVRSAPKKVAAPVTYYVAPVDDGEEDTYDWDGRPIEVRPTGTPPNYVDPVYQPEVAVLHQNARDRIFDYIREQRASQGRQRQPVQNYRQQRQHARQRPPIEEEDPYIVCVNQYGSLHDESDANTTDGEDANVRQPIFEYKSNKSGIKKNQTRKSTKQQQREVVKPGPKRPAPKQQRQRGLQEQVYPETETWCQACGNAPVWVECHRCHRMLCQTCDAKPCNKNHIQANLGRRKVDPNGNVSVIPPAGATTRERRRNLGPNDLERKNVEALKNVTHVQPTKVNESDPDPKAVRLPATAPTEEQMESMKAKKTGEKDGLLKAHNSLRFDSKQVFTTEYTVMCKKCMKFIFAKCCKPKEVEIKPKKGEVIPEGQPKTRLVTPQKEYYKPSGKRWGIRCQECQMSFATWPNAFLVPEKDTTVRLVQHWMKECEPPLGEGKPQEYPELVKSDPMATGDASKPARPTIPFGEVAQVKEGDLPLIKSKEEPIVVEEEIPAGEPIKPLLEGFSQALAVGVAEGAPENSDVIWGPHCISIPHALWKTSLRKLTFQHKHKGRWVGLYGDAGTERLAYEYSSRPNNVVLHPKKKTNIILNIEDAVKQLLRLKGLKVSKDAFGMLVVNWYEDGFGIPAHSDDEPSIDQNSPIISLSVGGSRVFKMTHNKSNRHIEVLLTHGSVVAMLPGIQQGWRHEVLPGTGERFNFTWRKWHPRTVAR